MPDFSPAARGNRFSRRHETNEVHYRVSTSNQDKHANKKYSAWARQDDAVKLTDLQRLAKLPAKGASKERAKLTARISAASVASKPKVAKITLPKVETKFEPKSKFKKGVTLQ